MSGGLSTSTGEPMRRFKRRAPAAEYIRNAYGFPCSPQWLAKLAVVGGGPRVREAGRTPVYEVADLDAWALDRLGIERREA